MNKLFSIRRTSDAFNGRIIWSQDQIDYITNHYNEFHSTTTLSKLFGVSTQAIRSLLRKQGIKVLSISELQTLDFPRNSNYFHTIDIPAKAYWLGFLYADGYISSKEFRIGLGISIKDIEHLEKYRKSLNYSKGMNIVTSHQFNSKDINNKNGETIQMCRTVITNEHMWKALNSKGCMPNKSLILEFPEESIFSSKDLIKHFIRGYVDGDGTLGVYPHSKTNPNLEASLLIVGTKPFLEGVQKYLGIDGFLMQKPNCNELTYRLGYSTKKAEKVAEFLYKDSTIYLERKYNIYTTKFAALKSGKNGEIQKL